MRILYVEDSARDADQLKHTLNRQEAANEVIGAKSLATARNILGDGRPFDLVLVDLDMPGEADLKLVSEIRFGSLPVAIVILTASGDEQTLMRILRAGADDYLVKRGDYLADLPQKLRTVVDWAKAQSSMRPAVLRVLYAGHHTRDIDLTRRHFARQWSHISIDFADSAQAVLAILPETPGTPCPCDVLLMDCRLPGTTAMDLIKTIRRERALCLPVVIVAGQGSEEVAIQCLRLGASDYIVKHDQYLHGLPVVIENAWQRARLLRDQATLSQSEERFRELFMNMHDGVAIYKATADGADFIFQQINPAGAEQGQVDADKVVGRSVREVFPGVVEMGLLEVFRNVWRTGNPQRHPLTLYSDNHVQMWVENYVCRLASGDIVAIYKNMTADKQAENSLRQSEKTLRTVIDTSPNCVFVRDAKGTYVLANKTLAGLYGVSTKEIIGTTDGELAARQGLKETDAQCFQQEDATVIKDQKPVTIGKHAFTPKHGSMRWFRMTKVPIDLPDHPRCVLGVATDITDQVDAEEQHALLFTAIEQSPEAIVITDRDGSIQYVNPAFETNSGYSRAEALNQNPRILKSDRHDESFYRTMWATLTQGKIWRGRIVNRRKNGGLYTEEVSISPVLSEKGQITHYVAVKQDISKELETEAYLRQAQKMEAIGTLAGGIAHDFNNILTSTIGFSELALDEVAKGSELEEYLKEIYISAKRARDLVSQILAFARQPEEAVQPIRVSLIVIETIKFLRSTVPTSIEIHQQLASDGMVLADPTQIHQVCMNLCTNAVQAMEERGGKLEVRLADRILDQGQSGMYGELAPGRYLVLSIADTGCGISADNMNSIFEPYFTTKGVGEGTGLGLAVVHGIVKGYGGEIEVASQPGQGTTVTVYLPRIDDREKMDTADVPLEMPPGRERILIVDDELAITRMIGKTFERQGYQVTIRTSSVEALALFQHNPDAFDLVITDMTMPILTGDRMATEMLKQRPDLAVILCTGYNKKITAETAASIGIRSLIMKPFSKREVLALARGILDGRKYQTN
jgi:PAS domain S-box-containing protein